MLAWQTERFLALETHARGPRRARAPRAGRRDRLRRRCRPRRATPAAWRCGSPGCCATATTRPPTRPTPSTTVRRLRGSGLTRDAHVQCNSELHTRTMSRMTEQPTARTGSPEALARPPTGAASGRRASSRRPASCSTQRGVRDAQIEDVARAVGSTARSSTATSPARRSFRAHRGRLPQGPRGAARDRRRPSARPRDRLRLHHRGVRRLRHRAPCLRRLRRDDPADGPGAPRRAQLVGAVPARQGHDRLPGAGRPRSSRPAGRPATSTVEDVDLVANMLYALGPRWPPARPARA